MKATLEERVEAVEELLLASMNRRITYAARCILCDKVVETTASISTPGPNSKYPAPVWSCDGCFDEIHDMVNEACNATAKE